MNYFKLYNQDCETVEHGPIDAIITDPPYGTSTDTDNTRFTGGKTNSRNHHLGIANDNKPFDPSWMLNCKKVCLFGFQYFADKLPIGTTLVWVKKRDNQLGTFCSDAEIAWMSGGIGCYVFNHVWNGFDRETERKQKSLHPNQKPVALWHWVFNKMKLVPGQTIFDPYMGSGSCAVAAMEYGLNYIGCEIIPEYFAVAEVRVTEARDKKLKETTCTT